MEVTIETYTPLDGPDADFLNDAAIFLVDPGLAAKSFALMGKPLELAQSKLPARARSVIAKSAEAAIRKAMVAALASMDSTFPGSTLPMEVASVSSSWFHKFLTSVAGAVSGFVGLPLLPIELPFTTVMILRGILDQARLQGHDLNDPEIRLEALMVFAMNPGSSPELNKNAEENAEKYNYSYFTTRAAFSRLAQNALSYSASLSARELLISLDKGSAPLLMKLLTQVAEKFQLRVTQKFIAESIPVAGAIGGSAINYAFTDYFVTSAKFHFGIRRLEQTYGTERVQALLKDKMLLAAQMR